VGSYEEDLPARTSVLWKRSTGILRLVYVEEEDWHARTSSVEEEDLHASTSVL
jgi:hypothetical protein